MPEGLRYSVVGEGARTVVVPGACWLEDDLLPLAEGCRVVFYDQRGRGRSGPIDGEPSLALEVRDLESLHASLGLGRVSLLGWSYLAAVTSHFAAANPEFTDSLLLVAPMLPHHDASGDDEAGDPAAAEEDARLDALRGDPEYAAEYWRVHVRRRMGNGEAFARMRSAAWRHANEVPDAISSFFGSFFASLGEWDFRPVIASVSAPVLVVHGERDVLPLRSSRAWAHAAPRGRLLVIPGSGHYPWLESPRPFFAAARAFLNPQEQS